MPDDKGCSEHPLEADTRASGYQRQTAASLLVPGLTVLYHPDLERTGERALLPGLLGGPEELLSRSRPDFAPPDRPLRRPLEDPYLSRQPLHLLPGPGPGSVRLVRAGSKTPLAANGEHVAEERTFSAGEVERGVVLLLADRVVLLLSRLTPVSAAGLPRFGLVGEGTSAIQLGREILRVAPVTTPVLIRGETGTGKELIARALHQASPRSRKPYLAVNMGAIPASLAAAELFGAARGAFTGADRPREGYFVRADGGTLFLDEIGETPPEVQVLLLRTLETGEIQPVGGAPRRVDVRWIAATDAPLEDDAAAGRFRAPLLHRLGGYQIRVAPLRRRREDLGLLLLHFLRQELEDLGESHRLLPSSHPWVPAPLVAYLADYDWPGNVRQLRNVVRQLVLAGRDAGEEGMWMQVESALREIVKPVPDVITDSYPAATPEPRRAPRKPYRNPEEVGEEEMLAALRAHRWRPQPAAEALGISRPSLYAKIEKSAKIRKAADLSRQEIEACLAQAGGDLDAMVEKLEVSKRGLQIRMTQLGRGRE
ncbi:MAG TPA: sigma 54-interacting transcriptional regulator [Thermoanaerobaculia bacterium]|nr:sigma 54-interacting transcriptional regulator [Thermoanaerobaculia bacterium]